MNSLSLGKMKGLTFTQYNDYKQAIVTYNRVEIYNSNVSTMRSGNVSLTYYEFVTYKHIKSTYKTHVNKTHVNKTHIQIRNSGEVIKTNYINYILRRS